MCRPMKSGATNLVGVTIYLDEQCHGDFALEASLTRALPVVVTKNGRIKWSDQLIMLGSHLEKRNGGNREKK